MPRLLDVGCIGDTRWSVRYLMREEKERLLGHKAKLLPLKQYVKFKCHIRFDIIKKFAKKCLDASSL